jgi:hypothetical protein
MRASRAARIITGITLRLRYNRASTARNNSTPTTYLVGSFQRVEIPASEAM